MRAVLDHWRFYVYHSLRSLWREKQRTAFALFCVVAGVASIVGLQTLGFLLGRQLIDEGIQVTIHHRWQIMGGDPNAMIRNPGLRIVIRSDFL